MLQAYKVPFSTKGEERLVFNLGLRECMCLGLGCILAVVAISIPTLFGVTMPRILYFIPLGIPPLAASAIVAFKNVKQFDNYAKYDESVINNFKFKHRVRNYIMYRK
ncbi:PrgI family mobile element protein [Pelotomaculum propionicicum]|uniref:PrgI family mobile element protein n=1 Tax=Pelotomaculum propionicicum TaxID=258475 RepID=UPI003B7874FD